MRDSRSHKRIIAINCYKREDKFFYYPMIFTYISDLYEAIIRKMGSIFSESFPILIFMVIRVKLSKNEEEHVFNELLAWSYDYSTETLSEASKEVERILLEDLGLTPLRIKKIEFEKTLKLVSGPFKP